MPSADEVAERWHPQALGCRTLRGVNRRVLAVLLAVASIGLIWLGTQIVDQSHGADPSGKLFIASWLESELWVNPWLIGMGLVGLLASILLLVFRRRRVSSQAT